MALARIDELMPGGVSSLPVDQIAKDGNHLEVDVLQNFDFFFTGQPPTLPQIYNGIQTTAIDAVPILRTSQGHM